MRALWSIGVLSCIGAVMAAASAGVSGQSDARRAGALDRHPAIQYATTPPTDRVARLIRRLADDKTVLRSDRQTGYLRSLLEALDVPVESQVLIFSKTGVQRAYTDARTPRALYFNDSVVVGYIPGAPELEIAAHDPQQGVIFYTIDQQSRTPTPVRGTICLTCHVSASTLNIPGLIARSNFVGDDGNVLSELGGHDVDHSTGHPDRWGGWYVTSEEGPPPYSQRAHQGNITFTSRGATSNEVFAQWLSHAADEHRYVLPTSDVVSLLSFDHQTRAANLLTRLDWEWRIAANDRRASVASAEMRQRIDETADYLLYAGEASMPAPLKAPAGLAQHFRARYPKDRQGRSLGEFDLVSRLARYPCSYMVYSPAFDALPAPVKQAIYARMAERLSDRSNERLFERFRPEDRRAALEILSETKPDFPRP